MRLWAGFGLALFFSSALAGGCSFVRDFDQFQFDEADGGTMDSSVGDSDAGDSGAVDAGNVDAGNVDAGTLDSGNVDAAGFDAGCSAGASQECGSDVGACSIGAQICRADGTWGPCTGAISPVAETCNGLDDDCDSMTDETPADTACANGCNTAAGACYACPIGGMRCVDTMSLETCADGSGWAASVCGFGCAMARNECNVCMPGGASCNDATTERTCNSSGTGFSASRACAFGCSPTYNQCRQCDPALGATQCSATDSTYRVDCNSSGFFSGSLNCPAVYPGTSPAGCNPATGRCYHQP